MNLNFSWVYVLAVAVMLVLSLWLMLGRFGDIRLGPQNGSPEFSSWSWFAMLFSAGMGTGLMFWGVAEPVMHLSSPPVGEPLSISSAQQSMQITFFHWGLHAWAIYAFLGVMLAYFCYRHKLPLLPRSIFYPILKDRIHGAYGDVVDMFAILGTMFGVAATLGMGVTQINAGLSHLFAVPQSINIQVLLIALITGMATTSVVLGLDGGIKKLSIVNLFLALGLMFLVLILGDSVALLRAFVQNLGEYLSQLTHKTFNLYAYAKKEDWIGGWTVLYWAWWISWAPFVSIFIARISKGRTIREFMFGVLLAPTLFTFLWMTVFGNSAMNLILSNQAVELAQMVNSNVAVALFQFFELFPLPTVLSLFGLLLVVTFFVSSSDSGSLVIDTLASGGCEEPPVWQRVFWGLTEGVVAAILLMAGGIQALQTMTIISAFPIIILILCGAYSLMISLWEEERLLNSMSSQGAMLSPLQENSEWKEWLERLTTSHRQSDVTEFLKKVVRPALYELKEEMLKLGVQAELIHQGSSLVLAVLNEEALDFRYGVKSDSTDTGAYAEAWLAYSGQHYDIFGYTKEQVITDVLVQYEKYQHFLREAPSKNL